MPSIVRLAANAGSQAVGNLIASAISVVTFAAVTRYLGPVAFGDLTAALAFLFAASVVADLGLGAGVLREISASPDRTRDVLGSSLPLRALLAVATLTAGSLVALALPLDDRTRTAIAIASVGAFLNLITLGLLPLLQARLQMYWAVAAALVGRLATLGLTLAVVAGGLGFKAIVWASVAGTTLTFVVVLRVVLGALPLRPRVHVDEWRALLRASVSLGLALALLQIYFRIDAVILATLRPSAEVGLYGASYKFVEFAQTVGGAIGLSVFPSLALFANDQRDRALRLAHKTLDLLLATGLGFFVLMLVAPEQLLGLVAGSRYREAAVALQILAAYPLLGAIVSLYWWLLVSMRRDRALIGISVAMLAFNIALNVALIPHFGYRAAAATSVGSEAAAVMLMVAVARGRITIRPNWRYIAAITGAAGLMTIVAMLLPGPRLLAATVGLAIYAVVLLVVPGTIRSVARDIVVGSRAAFAR
jgi:O-antigen/teichoic acid export membrane protein